MDQSLVLTFKQLICCSCVGIHTTLWSIRTAPLNDLRIHSLTISESTMILTKESVLALQVYASVGLVNISF